MSVESRIPDRAHGYRNEAGDGDPFTAAFRTSRMAMLITDARQPDNPIIFVNQAFLDLTGYSPEETVGYNCRFLQGPHTDPRTVDRIREAVAAGEGIETDILNYKRDGTPFWNSLVISPVRDSAHRVIYFFASQYDVSDKKSAQAELTRIKTVLEEEVSQRTQDLQSALDQKTALLHELDHRVKNSLQVISSLVLLKARRLSEPGTQQVLHNLAERISALSTVHRLLYSGGDVSRFDLRDFLVDLTDDLMGLLPRGQVELDLKMEPVAVSAAKAAPLALLMNELVSNALKHAYPDRRRGRLVIQVARSDGHLRIDVADDGIGMDGGAPPKEGFGRTLIDMLARQLKAGIAWADAHPGTRATVTMPLDAEETQN